MIGPRLCLLLTALGLGMLPGCLDRFSRSRTTPEENPSTAAFGPRTPADSSGFTRRPADQTGVTQDNVAPDSVTQARLTPERVASDRVATANPSEAQEPITVTVEPANDPAPSLIRQTVLQNPTSAPDKTAQQSSGILSPPQLVQGITVQENPLTDVKPAQLTVAASDPPVVLALKYVLEAQPDKALERLKDFDSSTRDFLIRILPAIGRLTQKPISQLNAEEVSVFQDELDGLLDTLRPFTALTINRMCCCQRINGFGNYEPVPQGHLFRAASAKGARDGEQVKVYIELRNFCSERRDPYHQIRLSGSVEIRDPREPADAEPPFKHRFLDQTQPVRTRGQLHDFFGCCAFSLPHMPPGVYVLTVRVIDETCPQRKPAVQSQEIRVTAMPLAAR